MITDLIKLIAAGEGLNIKLDALKDGRVRIVIVPRLADAPADANELQKKQRELLSTPLTLVDLPETLSGNLVDLIGGASAVFADARQQIASQVQGLQKTAADLAPVAPAKPATKPHQKPPRPTAADKDGIAPKQDDGSPPPDPQSGSEEEETEEEESAS